MDKKSAIVLGGTDSHIALIESLKERGYTTILIDYYENPPAKKVADRHIQESTLDQEKVLEISKELNAQLVISTSIDQANVTACYVGEKLGLPVPYSYQTALNVTNKVLMKKKMLSVGIPTSKFLKVKNIREFKASKLSFPVVVKPTDSTGSKGVRVANTLIELDEFLQDALSISRSDEAIVEEFIEGKEVQIDFFVQDGRPTMIMMREKLKMTNNGGTEVLQSIGSLIPMEISQKAKTKIKEITDKLVDIFNLTNTSLFIQAKVNGDDVNVIEFAPRVGGGLSYSMIKKITGFDILGATIDTFLGNKSDINYSPPDLYWLTTLIYADSGIFKKISGYKELLDKNIIEEFYFFKTKGMEIGSDLTSSNRVGAFLIKADTEDRLWKRKRKAVETLQVFDQNDSPIMLKEPLKNEQMIETG